MTVNLKNNILKTYFLTTYLIILYLVSDSIPIKTFYHEGVLPFSFMTASFFLYSLYYLLPAIAITQLIKVISQKINHQLAKLVYIAAVLSTSTTLLLLYANAKIFALYGMFFNGFILNLIMTPGGLESLGSSSISNAGFALIVIGFISLQTLILWLIHCFYSNGNKLNLSFNYLYAITIALTIIVHMGFALDNYTTNQLTQVSESIPFYIRVSAQRFYESLGIDGVRKTKLQIKGKLNYPVNPITFEQPMKSYNIIWLASESWRADTLNEIIMPNSWDFAKNAARFTRNYSTGNGTRMGIFGMFMGLPGNYWFPFLENHRGAAIIDVLQKQNYQMSFYTSAKFSYPEFEKTIFAQVPRKLLHDKNKGRTGWENDRDNVTNLLSFIDKRNPKKPFFTFMFFESPHARYYFPSESVIAKPYRDDINYATLSRKTLREHIDPIKNRYMNSVHHLDMQFGRIFEYLKAHRLLDSTIVILIGDHGEEFMEHGFWGHNSTFVDQQVRTPLVIYKPRMKPFVSDQMTSHMDVVPTIMPLLGVSNPSKDYAMGYNLFTEEKRDHTYISDWSKIAYVDDETKIILPFRGNDFALVKASKGNDEALNASDQKVMLTKKQVAMKHLFEDLRKLFKK